MRIIRGDIAGGDAPSVIRLCKEMALTGVFEAQMVSFGILNKKYKIIQELVLNDLLTGRLCARSQKNW